MESIGIKQILTFSPSNFVCKEDLKTKDDRALIGEACTDRTVTGTLGVCGVQFVFIRSDIIRLFFLRTNFSRGQERVKEVHVAR